MFDFDRFVLRHTGASDSDKIREFLKTHQSEFLQDRPPELLVESIAKHHGFVVEAVPDDQDRQIVALSMIYTHCEGEYAELGTTLVLPEVRGLGLQRLFHAVRASYQREVDPAATIVTCVDDRNGHSVRNIEAMGYADWEPDKRFLDSKEEMAARVRKELKAPKPKSKLRYFTMPAEKQIEYRDQVLGAELKPGHSCGAIALGKDGRRPGLLVLDLALYVWR